MASLLTIAYRNIGRNMRRTILCVVAVAIAVFFNIFLQSMTEGMTKGIEDVVKVFDTGHINVVSSQYEEEKEYYPVQYPVAQGRSTSEMIESIEAIPHIRAVLPRINAYATLQDSTVKHALLWGLNFEKEQTVLDFNLSDHSNGLRAGHFPTPNTNECVIGTALAKKAGLRIGDRIPLKTVSAQFSDKMWSPEIVGLFEFDYRRFDENAILVDFSRLQRLLVLGEGTQQLYIYVNDEKTTSATAEQIRTIVGDGNTVHEWRDNYMVAMMQQTTSIYIVIFLVFQIVASFLIVNTVVMIIHERVKEIGMMGTLGMTRREIVIVFFFEAVLLSVLGSLVGVIIGGITTGIGSIFPVDLQTFTGGGLKEYPITGSLFLKFSPVILLQGFLFGVIVAALCTLIPSLKSAFIEPVEALRQ
ncbi:MAG: ABC transporter permease [Treponema sp.]|jgi:putative ABC transport system permease protein|nr:ABC transporter permease [Treponema sp.]